MAGNAVDFTWVELEVKSQSGRLFPSFALLNLVCTSRRYLDGACSTAICLKIVTES